MLGNNPVRHQELADGSVLWVQEVFYTIQGEGPFAGHPAVFVRLGGCNLRCWFCDTDFESSMWQPRIDEIVEKVEALGARECGLVVVTGGEPFRQNIRPVVERLLKRGWRVQIETAGTLWVDLPQHAGLSIVCSPKTPTLNPSIIPRISAYKYVIAQGQAASDDGLPEMCTQSKARHARLARPQGSVPVYVMPLDEQNVERNAENTRACVDIAMRFGYRLTLQMHKLLGLN